MSPSPVGYQVHTPWGIKAESDGPGSPLVLVSIGTKVDIDLGPRESFARALDRATDELRHKMTQRFLELYPQAGPYDPA